MDKSKVIKNIVYDKKKFNIDKINNPSIWIINKYGKNKKKKEMLIKQNYGARLDKRLKQIDKLQQIYNKSPTEYNRNKIIIEKDKIIKLKWVNPSDYRKIRLS